MDCPDCGAAPDRWHRPGCTNEQCPYCGEQLSDCGCSEGAPPLDDRLVWTGTCFWLQACLHFDFFERKVNGSWEPCRSEDPGSQPDVNRLRQECVWNRDEKRFDRRQEARDHSTP